MLQRGDAAHAGADHGAAPGRVGLDLAGLLQGLVRGRHQELGEGVGATRLLGTLEVPVRVEPGDAALAHGRRAAQSLEIRLDADPGRRHDAGAGDRHPPVAGLLIRAPHQSCHQSFDVDQLEGLGDGGHALELLLVDVHVELLLEGHHQLDDVEAVGIEIVGEVGLGNDVGLLDRQHLDCALPEALEGFVVHGVPPYGVL